MNVALACAALAALAVASGAWAADPLDVPGLPAAVPRDSPPQSQGLALSAQTIYGIMPYSQEPYTHRIVLSCSDDILLYSMKLYVPGDGYAVAANSARLDGNALNHPGYWPQDEIRTDALQYPLNLGAGAFPVSLSWSLMIPVDVAGGSTGARIVADIVYIAGYGTTCSLDSFEPGRIGALFPHDSGFADFGDIMLQSAMLGIGDFNAYLEGLGEEWRLEADIRDTFAGDVALLADDLLASGVTAYLGPPDVGGVSALDGRDDSMVMVSCCATSGFLDRDDNVFSTSPSDTFLGEALARLMAYNDIMVLLPVWVDDPWNVAYMDSVAGPFAALGGVVDEGVSSGPGESLDDVAPRVRDRITSLVQKYGAERVGVLALPSEDMEFLRAISKQEGADSVRWFGTDYIAKDARYVEDPDVAGFTSATGYTALQVQPQGPRQDAVRQALTDATGKVATHDMLASYESAWVLGLAMLHSQSANPDILREAIPHVAERYDGTLGRMTLDANGSLVVTSLEVWSVHDNRWVLVGVME